MKTGSLMTQINDLIDKKINKALSLNSVGSRNQLYKYNNTSLLIGATDDGMALLFNEAGITKMAIGMLKNKDGTAIPLMAFGAGDGYGNNRGYIHKDTTGLAFYYIGTLASNEVAGIKILKNSIETTHPITVNKGLVDEFILNGTNWNAKLTEITAKAILENSSKNWEIPQENLSTTVGTKIDNGATAYANQIAGLNSTYIADAAITTAKIANLAVDNNKLAALSVDAAKLASGAVTTSKIFDDAITEAKIATDAVTSDAIKAANITTAKIANAAITTALIANAAITTALINDASITSAKIASAAVGNAAIASAAIGTAHIANGVIVNAHIADATITAAKIGSLNAEVISGSYISTQGWTGSGTSYIYMSKQMQIFKDNTLTKMAIGFLPNKDNVKVPLFVIGAGDGYGNNRGYIEKTTDGLSIYYVGNLSLGEVSYIKLKKDVLQLNGYDVFSKKNAISDSYISSATNWNNKTRNLNTSGDATSMNIYTSATGARIEILDTDKFQSLNSSGQKNGLYVSDKHLYFYYANNLALDITQSGNYNITNLDHTDSNGYLLTWLGVSGVDHGELTVYATQTWDFSGCTITGLSTNTSDVHNHGIGAGVYLAVVNPATDTITGHVGWTPSGAHSHTIS